MPLAASAIAVRRRFLAARDLRVLRFHTPGGVDHDQSTHGHGGGAGRNETLEGIRHGSEVDKLSYAENRAALGKLVDRYNEDPDFKGAVEVVSQYIKVDQPTGLATRAIVEESLKGRSVEEISADPKIQALLADVNRHTERFTADDVKRVAESSSGFYSTLRNTAPTEGMLYRGISGGRGLKEGKEIELRGPTALSHHVDSAMTYAGGTLIEIEPGAHVLPSRAMQAVKSAAEGDEFATLPAFYKRSDNSVHPKGPSHGYKISFDIDRELTTAGRFKVLAVEKKRVSYTDTVTGNRRSKSMTVVRVQQIGVF